MKNLICCLVLMLAWNVGAETGKIETGLWYSTNTKIHPNPAVLESVKKFIASIREEEASRIKMLDRLAELESKVEWIMENAWGTVTSTVVINTGVYNDVPIEMRHLPVRKSWKELYEGGK